jgi:hypothetical protein
MATPELDVRALRKPDKHPAVFKAYDALAAGESFVLVNNHDPRHLREEFEAEHPGSYAWDYRIGGPQPGGYGSASSPPPRCRVSCAMPRGRQSRTIRMRQERSGRCRCAVATSTPTSSDSVRRPALTLTPGPTSTC